MGVWVFGRRVGAFLPRLGWGEGISDGDGKGVGGRDSSVSQQRLENSDCDVFE